LIILPKKFIDATTDRSRRQCVVALGTGAVAALDGCGGDDNVRLVRPVDQFKKRLDSYSMLSRASPIAIAFRFSDSPRSADVMVGRPRS